MPVATMTGVADGLTLLDGTAVIVHAVGFPLPLTVSVVPAAGDTVAVSYSTDNGVTYTAWPNGAVTAAATDVALGGITHLKFQRTGGAGTTSTCNWC